MRKFIFIILIFLFFSCREKTIEDKIKDSFMEYVELNFDDPSKLKEIVSINFKDSISTQDFKEIVEGYISMLNETKSKNDSLWKIIENYVYSPEAKQNNNNELREVFEQNFWTQKIKVMKFERGEYLDWEIPKEIVAIPDTTIVSYVLKYRILKGNDLRIDSIFVSKGLNSDNFTFSADLKPNRFGPDMVKILNYSQEAIQNYKLQLEIEQHDYSQKLKMVEIIESLR